MVKRILIVDDEERIREVIRACLEDLGRWQALTAKSGAEGLYQAETESLDAILLDISMPDMDGFAFLQKLQQNPKTKDIPTILLTAKVLSHDWERFSQIGVAGVIPKPFNPVTICMQVAQSLGWSK